MPASPARAAAFEILLRIERESSYASELLHSPVCAGLSSRDHALVTELVLGVLRWRSRLDEEIAAASSQSLSKLDTEVLTALRLALYQLRCLDRIPKRAALNESVELVKRARKRSAAAFVNAVLRKLARKTESYYFGILETADLSLRSLASALAHPAWMIERWIEEYGPLVASRICEYDQLIPPTAIRLRAPSAEDDLKQEGVTVSPAQLLSSARVVITGEVAQTQAFRQGHVVIQDQASQLVAALVAPRGHKERDKGEATTPLSPRVRILDCCAAPGGKTLAMADRNPDASITAVELHPHRARLLKKLLRAAQVLGHIQVVVADAQRLPTSLPFDRVLADVPCSGTGTLARHPEIKWRLQPHDLQDLQARQSAILQSAVARVASGGRVVYSTCSLEREENEDVVAQALAQNNSFRVHDCRVELNRLKESGELVFSDVGSLTRGPYLRTIPGLHPCEGFFAAILQKI